jgi:hypothetical protein
VKRLLVLLAAALLVAYAAFAVHVARGRAAREGAGASAPELRGAWHVHTTASDGLAPLEEVAAAARAAGLDFVVVTDHNLRVPDRARRIDGVLVIPATEASTRLGHVVAIGVPRPLTREERDGDPLAAIRALGGEAVLAHPLHPRRPFRGWGGGAWRGMEVVSNDTSWGRVVADRDVSRVVVAALELPWDGPRAVLTLGDDPADELARFDAELRSARAAGEARSAARALFCSHDAHGYPSYRAAFEAFSMHVPLAPTDDDEADAAAISAALLDGRAACVFDGVARAAGVRLEGGRDGLALALRSAALGNARWTVVRDGAPVSVEETASPDGVRLSCAGGCLPGDYRVEGWLEGQPWIFTNPVRIE